MSNHRKKHTKQTPEMGLDAHLWLEILTGVEDLGDYLDTSAQVIPML